MTAIATLPRKVTYEEFQALPDDGHRYELIDGEVIMVGAPSLLHQAISFELSGIFRARIVRRGIGRVFAAPVEVKLPDGNSVQPDLVVVLNDRAHLFAENQIAGAPSLVLEILLPSNRGYDLITKSAVYARNGVPEYWVVDPIAETITVFMLRGGTYVPEPLERIARSRTVPGLLVDGPVLFAAARIA